MILFGLVLCGLFGAEIGGIAAGAMHLGNGADGVTLFVVSINLAPWTGIAGFGLLAYGRSRATRALEVAIHGPLPALRPVLAKVETARAVGEGPDIPLRLGLTIAPDESPGYRVDVSKTVNLIDMNDYRVGRIIVAAYDPDRPWRVEIPLPSAEWVARAAVAGIDSAPLDTLAVKPPPAPPVGFAARLRAAPLGRFATLAGMLVSVAVFWKQFTA
jgi:hypothetical protein